MARRKVLPGPSAFLSGYREFAVRLFFSRQCFFLQESQEQKRGAARAGLSRSKLGEREVQ